MDKWKSKKRVIFIEKKTNEQTLQVTRQPTIFEDFFSLTLSAFHDKEPKVGQLRVT